MTRRRYRPLRARPALPRRSLIWLPQWASDTEPMGDTHAALGSRVPNHLRIEPFRQSHDPLAPQLAAHLSLVFPFAANLTLLQLQAHVRKCVANWPIVPVTFRGIEPLNQRFVLLLAEQRRETLSALHDRLYSGVLAPYLRDDLPYFPHITLAHITDATHFAAVLAEAQVRLRGEWRAVLREITIVRHPTDQAPEIEATVPLNWR